MRKDAFPTNTTLPTGKVTCLAYGEASYLCASCGQMRSIPRVISSNGPHCIECVVAELRPLVEELA